MRTEREIGAFITIRAKTNREREWQRERNTKKRESAKYGKKEEKERQTVQTDR